jgi:hypothetical protein
MSLFGFQVVTRALVESAARSWWILAPEIEARQRVARAWVERWESLRELVRAAKAANQSVEGQVLGFRAEAAALGLSEDYDAKHRLKGFEGITRPGPTSLVPQFLSACGLRQGEMLYRFYSGVAHSALYGIHQYRQYHPTDDGKALRASANLTTQAVANAAVLGITAFLASGEAFAYLYGRDVEQVRLMRFQSAGRILTVEFGTSEI